MKVSSGTEHEDRFRRLYTANFAALLAYALRRVEQHEDAADVVAETFLVAWRRGPELPAGDEVRLWLYGAARRVLANHQHANGAFRLVAAAPEVYGSAGKRQKRRELAKGGCRHAVRFSCKRAFSKRLDISGRLFYWPKAVVSPRTS